MARERITRRQKNISRVIREKNAIFSQKLSATRHSKGKFQGPKA